jgi:hypothetical protein
MNTRQTPPSGSKPVAKPVSGKPLSSKPLSGKPRDQDKGITRKTVAEATGAPKREEAMLAAASYVHAIASDSAPARHMLSAAFERIERSFRAAGLGTVAVNRKLIDIARGHVASSFDLAKELAGARTPLEAARLQMAYFDERMKALASQAQELGVLQAEFFEKANEPIRAHVKRQIDPLSRP